MSPGGTDLISERLCLETLKCLKCKCDIKSRLDPKSEANIWEDVSCQSLLQTISFTAWLHQFAQGLCNVTDSNLCFCNDIH